MQYIAGLATADREEGWEEEEEGKMERERNTYTLRLSVYVVVVVEHLSVIVKLQNTLQCLSD